MNIRLISQDKDLYKLCREILAESPGQEWTVTFADSLNGDGDSSLHIWDFQPKGLLPQHINGSLSKHLFLVNRKDLADFREQVKAAESNILLKPVTKATLSAFLTLAVSSHEHQLSSANSLRADRDEILQCLIQTNLQLQEYDQDRTNFLARAVHDFRAPLTALSGYCGLLLAEPLGPLTDSQKEILQRMQSSSRRLSRMASAMFQLSVGRHVKRRPELQPADLGSTLEQALHEITPFTEEKCISISANLEPCPSKLYFEPEQIQQVLINILDNACKFTRKAGTIKISGYGYFWDRRKIKADVTPELERRQRNSSHLNSYRVDIVDSGEAIPAEHLVGIFEEYTSYSGGRDRSGGGLGLAICKMIITQHEGHVWAENTDFGPMFSFVLPLQRIEAGEEPAELLETVQKSA
jgi:signal transduction histidine kinase